MSFSLRAISLSIVSFGIFLPCLKCIGIVHIPTQKQNGPRSLSQPVVCGHVVWNIMHTLVAEWWYWLQLLPFQEQFKRALRETWAVTVRSSKISSRGTHVVISVCPTWWVSLPLHHPEKDKEKKRQRKPSIHCKVLTEVNKRELFRYLYYVWGWEEEAHRCGRQGTFQTCGIWRLACEGWAGIRKGGEASQQSSQCEGEGHTVACVEEPAVLPPRTVLEVEEGSCRGEGSVGCTRSVLTGLPVSLSPGCSADRFLS